MDEINNSYFVHEDDWGMIAIVLEQGQAEPVAAHGDLTISDLAAAFGEALRYTESLASGRTTAMKPVRNGFAFYHDLIGAVYGLQQDGDVHQLWFDNRICNCDHDFTVLINGLHQLGTQHGLALVDSWLDLRVSLSDRQRIETYVEEE